MRRGGRDVAVVSLHNRGIAPLPSDLAVDGSLGARKRPGLGRPGAVRCLGPRFAVLAPALVAAGVVPRDARRPTLVISLGGGTTPPPASPSRAALQRSGRVGHVSCWVWVCIRSVSRRDTAWPAGVEPIAPERLRRELARATLAVVAGGTTLYEACALGTPVVAVRGGAGAAGDGGAHSGGPASPLAPVAGSVPGGVAGLGRDGGRGGGGRCWGDAVARRRIAAAARPIDRRTRRGAGRTGDPAVGDDDEGTDGMNTLATMRIGGRPVGGGAPLFVVAEIGLNHDGDPARALALVDAAAAAGADAVKLQSLRAETLVAPDPTASLAHVDAPSLREVFPRRLIGEQRIGSRRGRGPAAGKFADEASEPPHQPAFVFAMIPEIDC